MLIDLQIKILKVKNDFSKYLNIGWLIDCNDILTFHQLFIKRFETPSAIGKSPITNKFIKKLQLLNLIFQKFQLESKKVYDLLYCIFEHVRHDVFPKKITDINPHIVYGTNSTLELIKFKEGVISNPVKKAANTKV